MPGDEVARAALSRLWNGMRKERKAQLRVLGQVDAQSMVLLSTEDERVVLEMPGQRVLLEQRRGI